MNPTLIAVWRQTPQTKNLRRLRFTDGRDFIGLYGHVAFRWNVLVGVVRPRFNFRLLLPAVGAAK